MSDEAMNLEQMFDEGSSDNSNMEMDDSPESFDDLMEDVNDSSIEESMASSEEDGINVPDRQHDSESEEIADKDRSDASKADSDSSKREEEDREAVEDVDPLSKYLQEEEEVKVNGELQKFSREHILSKGKEMIAGEIAYDKKFSELDMERRQYKNEVSEVEGYINKFGEIAQTGDILGALQYFSEFTSIPPYELKQQLISQLVPEVDRLRSLSDAEAQLEYSQQKNEYLQNKYETETKRMESYQAQREVMNHVNSLQQTHDIAPNEWSEAESILQEHLKEDQELTPELVANYVITDRAYAKAEGLLDSVDVSLKEDGPFLDEMQRIIARNPQFTDEDLKEIIIEALGNDAHEEEQQEQLVQRVNKSSPKQLKQKSPDLFKPITIDGEEVEDFDDLI